MRRTIPNTYRDDYGTYYLRLYLPTSSLKLPPIRLSLKTKDYKRAKLLSAHCLMVQTDYCRKQRISGSFTLLDKMTLEETLRIEIDKAIEDAAIGSSALAASIPREALVSACASIFRKISPVFPEHLKDKLRAALDIECPYKASAAMEMTIESIERHYDEMCQTAFLGAINPPQVGTPDSAKFAELLQPIKTMAEKAVTAYQAAANTGGGFKPKSNPTLRELHTEICGKKAANAIKHGDKVANRMALAVRVFEHYGATNAADIQPSIVKKVSEFFDDTPVGLGVAKADTAAKAGITLDKLKADLTAKSIRDGKSPIAAAGTRNDYKEALKNMLEESYKLGYAEKDYSHLVNKVKDKKSTKAENERRAFADSELVEFFKTGVFSAADLKDGRTKPTVSKYWSLLVCALQGMRRGEVAQLRVENIKNISGEIPTIEVTDAHPFQRLKNYNSMRDIPINPRLIELGFLDFVTEAERLGYEWLFPDYAPDCSLEKGQYEPKSETGTGMTRAFTGIRKKMGLEDDKRFVLHSLRHTMCEQLRKLVPSDSVSATVTGHAKSTFGKYGGYDAAEMRDALGALYLNNLVKPQVSWEEVKKVDSKWRLGRIPEPKL